MPPRLDLRDLRVESLTSQGIGSRRPALTAVDPEGAEGRSLQRCPHPGSSAGGGLPMPGWRRYATRLNPTTASGEDCETKPRRPRHRTHGRPSSRHLRRVDADHLRRRSRPGRSRRGERGRGARLGWRGGGDQEGLVEDPPRPGRRAGGVWPTRHRASGRAAVDGGEGVPQGTALPDLRPAPGAGRGPDPRLGGHRRQRQGRHRGARPDRAPGGGDAAARTSRGRGRREGRSTPRPDRPGGSRTPAGGRRSRHRARRRRGPHRHRRRGHHRRRPGGRGAPVRPDAGGRRGPQGHPVLWPSG